MSGYPGSHGLPAMAGSIYPGQASLLDQADSWNHRPQEISVWQPNVEVSAPDAAVVALLTINTLLYHLDTFGGDCRKMISLVFFKLPYYSGAGVMSKLVLKQM